MISGNSILKGSFSSIDMDNSGGKRPVVFDILSPDLETSILPDYMKLVAHVNPSSMKFSYQNIVERIPTMGGFVEQHFGSGIDSIAMDCVTGGFMRLYTGLMGNSGGGLDIGGTRRDTLAYDSYLDMLALFHNNGAVYDMNNNIILHGIIKIMFDGDYWLGWFENFNVTEDATKPYMLSLTMNFTVSKEYMGIRSLLTNYGNSYSEPFREEDAIPGNVSFGINGWEDGQQ